MHQDEMRMTVLNDRGEEVACVILFVFEMDGKEYVVYTDETESEEGSTNVYASILGEDDSLLPIETDAEWDVIQQKLEALTGLIKESESLS